ncbi:MULTISPECIES: hypothetical protein [unclassified Tenacibaculum]|uniref:hypothetical protein n=1 Tax=unclassified Tenacibaculum TaxID=2635139 RepID=UPI001F1CF978|nr:MULTISPECIES: hypothetical protein [unclassified Tenacibaculum]MCF2875212.1 hypothetical protein [Tenacibaculum sp. Cn5-1]MCF2935288.1 hypothetical protein [Tenacibaculum sp. Cn5-34]MCG7511270.1 hypothetical protein [Tenacibaculum sp. Cn5-46]
MQNTEDLDSCPSNCCSPNKKGGNKGMKIKLGLGIFTLAFILAITSAFKEATSAESGCSSITKEVVSKDDFKWIATDKEVVYVFLKGNDSNKNKVISNITRNVVSELNSSEGAADYLELEKTENNFKEVVSKLNIKEIPTIVVLGKGVSIVKNIHLTTLIRAYDSVLDSKVSCSVNSKASCNTKLKETCATKQKASCKSSNK